MNLCDLCKYIELDGNEYYVTNANYNKKLYEYDFINKDNIIADTYENGLLYYNELDEDFDMCDVAELFALIKINTLEELEDFRKLCGGKIIIQNPYKWDYFQIPKIIIYDGYIE